MDTSVLHSDKIRILLLLVLVLVLGACSDSSDLGDPDLAGGVTEPDLGIQEAGEAEPAAGPGALTDGDFAEIPLPTAAQVISEASVIDDVTAQTFIVTADSVNEVIGHFDDVLPPLGWVEGETVQSGNPEPNDVDQLQSSWTMDGMTLLVTAVQMDRDVQLSLQLSSA